LLLDAKWPFPDEGPQVEQEEAPKQVKQEGAPKPQTQ
jgi:hypothetical protein